MEATSFTSLATLRLPSASRLLPSACCPDKDLVVLVSKHGTRDRISLWKLQGSKKWEIDIEAGPSKGPSNDEVVDLAWSADGQTVAIAHNPPRITLHSVQDGYMERSIPVLHPYPIPRYPFRITGIWWFNEEKKPATSTIPDIFKRNGIITGSAQALLKIQPLLDPLKDDMQPLTAADLFAFQGSQLRSQPRSKLPEVIISWPTLPTDLLSASIQPAQRSGGQTSRPGEELDEVDNSNVNSILVVADDRGYIHCFLDGSYPLGCVSLGQYLNATSLKKDRTSPLFFVHGQTKVPGCISVTGLRPIAVQLPLLQTRIARDAAWASSTARELLWYVTSTVKEMRRAWFGSENQPGARELGPKWIRTLEARQREQFGQDEPNAMLDLTYLLVTGRASESITDFLGSAEQMSERGIQKWESTVIEVLIKLRDYSEKRLAPALQRLHIILDEVRGWSLLPRQYGMCEISTSDVDLALELVDRAIPISAWLAATARREFSRFKEFIKWIRYETSHINHNADTVPPLQPRHDFMEVNNYLMSGLVVSAIDKWFMGPVPRFSPKDLGVPGEKHDLKEALHRARRVMNDPARTAWKQNVKFKDLSHLDRNLDSLIQDLGIRCMRLFTRVAGATGRSAVVSRGPGLSQPRPVEAGADSEQLCIRERTVEDEDQVGGFVQYLAIRTPLIADRSFLCVALMNYRRDVAEAPLRVEVALLDCCTLGYEGPDVDGTTGLRGEEFDVLDVEFFDEDDVVLVYRIASSGTTFIATVNYKNLDYQELKSGGYVNGTREDLLADALQQWRDKQLLSARMPIKRSRELAGCRQGSAHLAVNGRVGRRVACVLDNAGMTVEVVDMEGDTEDVEGEVSVSAAE